MPGPDEHVIEQPAAQAPAGRNGSPTAPFPDDPSRFREPDSPAETRLKPDNLQERLEHLPPGHPSLPFRDDGSRKPPPPDQRHHELPLPDEPGPDLGAQAEVSHLHDLWHPPEPLTDEQYAEHVQEVNDRLAEARAAGLATNEQHTIDDKNQVWSKERRAVHKEVIDDLYARAQDAPNERRGIIAGGLPGAGKTTVLDGYAGIDRTHYLTIDPDKIKEELARRNLIPQIQGLTPMESADLVHEESSYIARRLARRAQADGKNIIWDITMSSYESVAERVDKLRSASYGKIEGIFVDITLEVSKSRAMARHREGLEEFRQGIRYGGRFVPEELIAEKSDTEWGSVNRKTFEEFKHRFDAWSVYDNSTEDRAPLLVSSSTREERQP